MNEKTKIDDRSKPNYLPRLKVFQGSAWFSYGVTSNISGDEAISLLSRHTYGEWDNTPEDVRAANERALSSHEPIVSFQKARSGIELKIVTSRLAETEESTVTHVLLVSEVFYNVH